MSCLADASRMLITTIVAAGTPLKWATGSRTGISRTGISWPIIMLDTTHSHQQHHHHHHHVIIVIIIIITCHFPTKAVVVRHQMNRTKLSGPHLTPPHLQHLY
mmetsp:Transcript_29656/g.65641  ORF Transcript_29656/g.65641 Transcript_29656/m.65641 type:complete len:103 (-) Transcript_29656:162-470(-)